MISGTIHRMIFWELVKIFFLSLIGLTGMILMAGIISEAAKNGLSPMQILTIIPILLPNLLPYTVPTTTLFATCIVYGRLSADNEILALKAAGIHIVHVVWPALFLGVATSVTMMVLHLEVIPRSHHLLRSTMVGDVEELLYAMLRRDGSIRHPKINMEIHINGLQGRKLHDVIFMRKAANGNGFDVIARAKEAELRYEPSKKRILVQLFDCQIIQAQGNPFDGVAQNPTWPIELPPEFTTETPKVRGNDMTWLELFEYERAWKEERKKIDEDINLHQAAYNLGKGQSNFPEHINNLISFRKMRDQQINGIHVEWHLRPAFALGCLCFALVGCPVGIWFSRSDYLSAFITCFLPIVTMYYPLMLCMIKMGHTGRVAPWIGLYAADALMLVAGVFLFSKLARN